MCAAFGSYPLVPRMAAKIRHIPLDSQLTPEQVVLGWPAATPLAALCSGPGDPTGTWARWSYFASPTVITTIDPADPDPLATMARHLESVPAQPSDDPDAPPFLGGWFVTINYEVGETIEPAAAGTSDRRHPLWPWAITLLKCPWAYAHDRLTNRWWLVGPPGLVERREAASQAVPPLSPLPPLPRAGHASTLRPSELNGSWHVEGESYFRDAVTKAVEYVHAGDIFQVNLAHRLAGGLTGSARSFFVRAFRRSSPRYGAYLEIENHAEAHDTHVALSLSPELFLRFDPSTRTLITRPIKGTLHAEHSADTLRESVKNQAELNMIIDLMRNDLGRVAEFGSVRVDESRIIETHAVAEDTNERHAPGTRPAIHHGVGTVRCRVRPGVTLIDILRATFPAGSITGAPKVRAMQIINELHDQPAKPRGLYTGAIGYISDSGHMALNVAIRTAMIRDQRAHARPPATPIDECSDAQVEFPVGAGIVADSDPQAEWQETLDKARVFTDLVTEPRASAHAQPR